MEPILIPADHPALAGHFPGNPIVPGALLLAEALVRLELHAGKPVWRVARAKFSNVLLPGKRADVSIASDGPGRYRVRCTAGDATCLDAVVDVGDGESA